MKQRRAIYFLLVFLFAGALGAEEGKQWKSPDGRFVFRRLQESHWGIVEPKTGKTVMGGTDSIQPMQGAIAAVWAKDSRHVAINLRAGGRWNATLLYAWTGKGFTQLTEIDGVLEKRMETERKAELKQLKLPEETYLRRIWDTHRTLRWRDAQTVEVLVDSIRSYVSDKEKDETSDIQRKAVFTVRFDAKGAPEIVERRELTAKEAKDAEAAAE